MSIPCPVERCTRPMPGTSQICGACAGELARALADVPWLAAQLRVSLTRQVRIDRPTGKSDPDPELRQPGTLRPTPLPYDERAREAAFVLRSALVGWVRVLADLDQHDDWPGDELPSMARWLTAHHAALIRHPAAAEAHDEITSAVRQAERAIDGRAERWYAGPCACGEDLYARPGAAIVTCRGCAETFEVAERRSYLLAAAEDTLAGATLIAQALTSLGQPVTPERLRKWAQRGRIIARGADLQGRAIYRVGDVIELLAAAPTEKVAS